MKYYIYILALFIALVAHLAMAGLHTLLSGNEVMWGWIQGWAAASAFQITLHCFNLRNMRKDYED